MTVFDDLDDYLALPRVSGLAASPDGSRLVTTVSTLNDKRTEFLSAIWELDPAGVEPARRLTHGLKGESAPAFTAEGDLLFVAVRAGEGEDKPPAALWRLPAAGGEAVEVLAVPGGVTGAVCARAADATVVAAPLLPSSAGVGDDKARREARKDNKVSAILHTGYPVRYWDHDLGPDQPHLFDADGPRDLTADPGAALRETIFDLSADAGFVVTSWRVHGPGAAVRLVLVRIDRATGERTTIAEEPGADLDHPAIAPDCSAVAFTRETHSTPTAAPRITLCCMRFGDDPVELTTDWDRWPSSVAWSADSSALIVTADDGGRGPIFSVDPASGAVTRLTDDDFTYTDVRPAPGGVIYALRSSYAVPSHPVRIDPDGTVTALPCVDAPELPGILTEVTATAADGTPIRSWLTLPAGDQPAPLVLWIHGGPLGSWNSWHWRWNPWLLTAQGYAVLMPDPGLSTGYGQDFIARGWGAWGGDPYTDLMAATDAACAHPRVDASRTAAMGGSFGGYMANWIAGHTDRFDAIVTHASLWALDQFGPTTDGAYWWAREMTPEMAQRNSPHRFVGEITTPMLVIHGDKDYRVPIGEALRLWYELLTYSGMPADENGESPHRFLYYPTENHWVLAPQHAKIWYQVVTAFLSEYLGGEPAQLPELLG
ncbi:MULTISPECIES: S9 family peptidase [unclassified Mycolicibacterium]|uniref:S9 family peptidase n=1 Tax=unclassified Mycolicibacterium TaxID=2636767 RepID=UPI0012DC7A7F|nr:MULTISPECIES: S9 family peptidase [unclassified Mycolicibacterium]MUL83582.1 S9 family peptidase [Mycolicibacterium sp. CBMA 329]MUL90573.1 S9 family peptidase [Mycolicibacterium sp. CBMA 331]MUM00543.1 S9 family peptidase [Mycolicibacterium sp. CBMA 334]MUM25435.1 S9 family peptidase [Mycolicibacterium sp. CBMA 295]MUM41517.1 S9 family peptidase [Mycolicibacterium sp. CBMA 247]